MTSVFIRWSAVAFVVAGMNCAWSEEPPVAPPAPKAEVPADIQEMKNPQYLLDLGRVHLNYGALDRAEPLLKQALENAAKPEMKNQVRQTLAQLLQRKQDFKGVAEMYTASLEGASPKERLPLLISLADSYEKTKDFAAAEKVLLELVTSKELESVQRWMRQDAQRRLVRLWQQQPGRLDAVKAEAEAASAKDPKDESALERLAMIHAGPNGDPAKAVAAYEKLNALRPDRETVRELAVLYSRTQQSEKAAELFKKLATESQQPAEARQYTYQAAQVLLQSGKKAEAVEYFKTTFAGTATSPMELSMAASFFESANAPEEAEKALSKAMEAARTPNEKADISLRLAETYRSRKDYAKSEQMIRAVRKEHKADKGIHSRATSALVRLYESQNKIGELKLDE